jgi:hypothetical protein
MKALAGKVAMSVMIQTELADIQRVVTEDITTVICNLEIMEVIVDMVMHRIMEATRIQDTVEWVRPHMVVEWDHPMQATKATVDCMIATTREWGAEIIQIAEHG